MESTEIIKKIKQKKELSGIDDSIVSEELKKYAKKSNLSIENLSERELKIIVKDIRSKLRKLSGRFQIGLKKRYNLLEKKEIFSLLRTHSSTKERMDFYPKLKELLTNLKVNSVLDLGCGINPIALANPNFEYYASDINQEELNLIQEFFDKNKINGKTFFCDLKKIENYSLPKTDICLILKVFDILGNHLIAEKILNNINSNYILASFSTKTLSGKPMNKPRRIWFEKLLEKFNFSFELIGLNNEVFYLIRKN